MRKTLSFIAFAGLCSVSSLSLAGTSPPSQAARPAIVQEIAKQQVAPSGARPHAAPAPAKDSGAKDKVRYADKEAASPTAQDYKGGDTVVIGATAATAILAVLLLIILI